VLFADTGGPFFWGRSVSPVRELGKRLVRGGHWSVHNHISRAAGPERWLGHRRGTRATRRFVTKPDVNAKVMDTGSIRGAAFREF